MRCGNKVNIVNNNNTSIDNDYDNEGNINIDEPNVNNVIDNNTQNGEVENTEYYINEIDSTMKKNKIRNLYFSIESSINTFFKYINIENQEAVYSILSNEYINENKITSRNVLKKLNKKDNFIKFVVEDIYTIERLGSYSNFVKGTITYGESQEEWFALIDADIDYKYYQITPYSKDEYINKVNNEKTADLKEIKKNEYNIMTTTKVSDETMCSKYFNDYKEKMLNNPEKAYEMLDEEYKKNNFSEFSKYEQYLNDNKEMIKLATLIECSVETIELSDDYEYVYNYILKDNNNITYTIIENAIMDYTVKIDR